MWPLAMVVAAGLGLAVWYAGKQGEGDTVSDNSEDKAPRGIRNNNPGNIRRTGTDWQGLAERQTDPEYLRFRGPVWGIRAMARTLKTYRDRHGLQTVNGIIKRWAPKADSNPTAAYAQHIADRLGVAGNEPLAWDAGQVRELIKGIIQFENGTQPYTDTTIRQGISKA